MIRESFLAAAVAAAEAARLLAHPAAAEVWDRPTRGRPQFTVWQRRQFGRMSFRTRLSVHSAPSVASA